MERSELLHQWMNGRVVPAGESLGVEGDALLVDGWWPVAVRLDPTTFMLRIDDTCPHPQVPGEVAAALTAGGFENLDGDWAVVESISLQRLGLLGARWQIWGVDRDSARRAVSRAVAGDEGPAF